MTRRVVITGMGTVNSLCCDVPGLWSALLAGKSGIGSIEQFDTSAFKVHFGGEVKNFDPEPLVDKSAFPFRAKRKRVSLSPYSRHPCRLARHADAARGAADVK